MLWNVASHKDPSWIQDFSPFNDLPDQIKEGEIEMYASHVQYCRTVTDR